jgi:predicted Rossmann-fold nucleotide-binding protein
VRSYIAEKATHESAYAAASGAGSSVEAHDVRRAREFVEEAAATLRDVRQRLQESFVGLQRFLGELAVAPEHAVIMEDPCMAEARAMLDEVAPLVQQGGGNVDAAAAVAGGAAAPSAARVTAVRVCVLGDSSINEDDALWGVCEQLGEALVRAGFHIVTGGYSGTAEAVAFGASRHAAAASASAAAAAAPAAAAPVVSGVVSSAAFAGTSRSGAAGPNQYLTEQLPASDLLERAQMMLRHSDAVVVLPGGLGTLTKLSLAWNSAAVHDWCVSCGGDDACPARPVLAWRDPWEAFLGTLSDALRIPADLRSAVAFVGAVDEVLAALEPVKNAKLNNNGGAAATKGENRELSP